jgi:uncharacterized RDD family membrane protein YckC
VSSASSDQQAPSTYPGERLGFPPQGRGSVVGWGRRIAALFVDWFASLLVATAVGGSQVMTGHGWQTWLPLAVFWVEASFFTALLGGSFGQLVMRVMVVHVDGRPVSLLVALVRTLMICLVVPPVIYNGDRRGMHDLAARTVTLRR